MTRPDPTQAFLSSSEREEIIAAIREAETKSTGEIKVYFEKHCKADVLDRAAHIFHQLKMDKTDAHTGILIYIAYVDHLFAIIGDKGINAKVPSGFWDETKALMEKYFREGKITEGLIAGIRLSGEPLKKFFGVTKDNLNEIADDIIIADE